MAWGGGCSRLPQEFQEVSDPLLLLPPRTSLWNLLSSSPVKLVLPFGRWRNDGASPRVWIFILFVVFREMPPPHGCLTAPTADSEVLFGTAESPETHA